MLKELKQIHVLKAQEEIVNQEDIKQNKKKKRKIRGKKNIKLYQYFEVFQKSTQFQEFEMQFAKSRNKSCLRKTVTLNNGYQKNFDNTTCASPRVFCSTTQSSDKHKILLIKKGLLNWKNRRLPPSISRKMSVQ